MVYVASEFDAVRSGGINKIVSKLEARFAHCIQGIGVPPHVERIDYLQMGFITDRWEIKSMSSELEKSLIGGLGRNVGYLG